MAAGPDGGELGQDLVLVTVRGVQQFIAEARSTADLQAGSTIMSGIAEKMIAVAREFHPAAELVLPSQAGRDSMPNRVAVRVAAGYGRDLARHMADRAREAWRDRVASTAEDLDLVGDDTPGFPDVQWVVARPELRADGESASYEDQWQLASAALAARKRVRNFVFPPMEQVRICSLTGRWTAVPESNRREAERPRSGGRPWNVRQDEALSLASHVKRKFSRDARERFPSTWSLASAPCRTAIIEAGEHDGALRDAVSELRTYVGELLGNLSKADRAKLDRGSGAVSGIPISTDKDLAWLRSAEGAWCVPWTWDPAGLRVSNDLADLPDAEDCYFVRDAAAKLAAKAKEGGLPPLTSYLAVIAQDADHMGERLGYFPEGRDPVTWHQDVSAALETAARAQREAIENRGGNYGRVVYAGGDDLLALAPAATALNCVRDANAAFSETLTPVLDDPSASAAIVYFHASWPLQSAVVLAQELLKEAKAERRPGLGVAVLRRGGERSRLIAHWRDPRNRRVPMIDHLDQLAISMSGTAAGLSARLASELERDRQELESLGSQWLTRELLRRNARHGGAAAEDALLAFSYGDAQGRRKLPSDAVNVARFLASEAFAAGEAAKKIPEGVVTETRQGAA